MGSFHTIFTWNRVGNDNLIDLVALPVKSENPVLLRANSVHLAMLGKCSGSHRFCL